MNKPNLSEVFDGTVPSAKQEGQDLINGDAVATLIDRAERTESLAGVKSDALRFVIAQAESRNVSNAAKTHLLQWADRAELNEHTVVDATSAATEVDDESSVPTF